MDTLQELKNFYADLASDLRKVSLSGRGLAVQAVVNGLKEDDLKKKREERELASLIERIDQLVANTSTLCAEYKKRYREILKKSHLSLVTNLEDSDMELKRLITECLAAKKKVDDYSLDVIGDDLFSKVDQPRKDRVIDIHNLQLREYFT